MAPVRLVIGPRAILLRTATGPHWRHCWIQGLRRWGQSHHSRPRAGWQGKMIQIRGNKTKKKPQIIIHEIHRAPLHTPYATANTVTGASTVFLNLKGFACI